jgi:hypothetical protein
MSALGSILGWLIVTALGGIFIWIKVRRWDEMLHRHDDHDPAKKQDEDART